MLQIGLSLRSNLGELITYHSAGTLVVRQSLSCLIHAVLQDGAHGGRDICARKLCLEISHGGKQLRQPETNCIHAQKHAELNRITMQGETEQWLVEHGLNLLHASAQALHQRTRFTLGGLGISCRLLLDGVDSFVLLRITARHL